MVEKVIFWHIILYYFKKCKNSTEMQKKKKDFCSVWRNCCDCFTMSKVVCKVLCCRCLNGRCPQSGRPVEVDSDQIETLIENNQHYTTQKIDDILKYPNQALKIICINLVNHFDVWVPHKWKKSFLTIFPHAVLYWNITKHPVFKTNFDGQWKVDTVQKYGVEENVGQVKWTITNHTKGQSSSKEGVVVYMVELERSPLLWAPSRKPND